MLSMAAIYNFDYYTKDDYYLSEGIHDSEWAGKGAALLGLEGVIDENEYRNLMQGYSPAKDYALCNCPGKGHRNGWDLSLAPSKSFSVEWARAGDAQKEILHLAHNTAVNSAIAFIEKQAGFTRRGVKGQKREKTAGLVVAKFHHFTSRALDPQIHTHCLVANVAPRNDGTWGTIVSKDLYLWQKAAGAIYRAELTNQLEMLGYKIDKDGKAFSIRGVPTEVCGFYAKRSKVIRDELKQKGQISSASKVGDFVAKATREKKQNLRKEELFNKWHTELDDFGFYGADVRSSHVKDFNQVWEDACSVFSVDILSELSEFSSTFRKQDIYLKAAEYAQWFRGGAREAQLLAKLALSEERCHFLAKDYRGSEIFTVQETLDAEMSLISSVKKLVQKDAFSLDSRIVENSLYEKDFPLTEEQTDAVRYVCQKGSFSILQGSAGAGKSASMECVNSSYTKAGYKVIGACIAKSAAKNLEKESGIPSRTISKLILDCERNPKTLSSDTVLLIDEAGQVGVRQLAHLLELAESSGSKVVLVGEDKQLDAIQHGGALRYLSDPKIVGTSRINTIMRQKKSWARQAVADFRDGNASAALKEYNERGLLHLEDGDERVKEGLISRWNQMRNSDPKKALLVLAQQWKDVIDINSRIRGIYKNEGKVSERDYTVKCWISDRCIKQDMAVGERIKLTKNDYRKGLTNGDLGTITSIQERLDGKLDFSVSLDCGRDVVLNSDNYGNEYGHMYITQAYALTVYSSQGLTIDGDVFVHYKSSMDRASSYVACSRHKENCHIFANQRELKELAEVEGLLSKEQLISTLAESMSRDKRPKLAIEYLSEDTVKTRSIGKNQEVDLELFA